MGATLVSFSSCINFQINVNDSIYMSLYVVKHVYIILNEIFSNICINSCDESLHHEYHCVTYILFKYKIIITCFMREQCDIRGFQCDVIAG